MLEAVNIVGVHFEDPKLPGTLYLADEDGTLTRNPQRAKKVKDSKLQKALEQIRKVTCQSPFVRQVAEI